MFRNAIKKKDIWFLLFLNVSTITLQKKKIKGIFLHIIEYFIQYRCISDKNVSIIKKKKIVLIFELFFVSTVKRIDKRDCFFLFFLSSFFFFQNHWNPPDRLTPPEAICRNETDYQLFSIAVYVTMTSSLVSLSWG